ncbi:hypothetical protein [Solitalea longa]|nr:hypothetical protein [Solitalea longa]
MSNKKNTDNYIPRTVLVYKTVNTDLIKENGEELLFADEAGFLIAKFGRPVLLFAPPDAKLSDFPQEFQEVIINLESISLKEFEILNTEVKKEVEFNTIPNWLPQNKSIRQLELANFKIENLKFLKETAIETLLLSNNLYENREEVINNIKDLKNLKILINNNQFTKEEIDKIKDSNPKLIVRLTSEDGYDWLGRRSVISPKVDEK